MALVVPSAVEQLVRQADAAADPISEIHFAGQLMSMLPDGDLPADERRGALAEITAWRLMRGHDTTSPPWGIYWTPLTDYTTQDGVDHHSPDIAEVDDETLALWVVRAQQAQHPTIRARYADLAWEVGRFRRQRVQQGVPPPTPPVTTEFPVALAHTAVDAYLEAISKRVTDDEHQQWTFLERSAILAASISDKARVAAVKAALFAYYQQLVDGGKTFMWWRLSEITVNRRKALEIDAAEEEQVYRSLERSLARHSNSDDKPLFHPHWAQDALNHMRKWRTLALDEAQRLTLQVGKAFETAAAAAGPMLAIAWLEEQIPKYVSVGLAEDAARLEGIIRARAGDARGEMKSASVEVKIPHEEMKQLIDELTGGSSRDGLMRIGASFVIGKTTSEESIKEILKSSTLVARIRTAITGPDGLTVATIGSLDDDLIGRSIHYASERVQLLSPILDAALKNLREKYQVDLEALILFLKEAPFYSANREPLLRAGLEAWLNGDAVKATHVLVPQVEATCRDLLAYLGGGVMRRDTEFGGFEALGMGAVITQPLFRQLTPEDIRFHLAMLYVDKRGINLRNSVAHGIAHIEQMSIGLANWIVHSLLLLAMLRPKVAPDEAPAAEV